MKKFIIAKLKGAFKKSADRSKRSTRKHISNPRRGVSIVELAVALAIISIVSGSALSIMLASSKNESKMMREIEVTNQAENAIECFRYVVDGKPQDTVGELERLLNQTAGNLYQNSGNTISLKRSAYSITITVDFEANTLKFESKDKDEKEIYSIQYAYTKG